MPNPKISIIIPTYNHAKELKKCLESIAKQTFQDFEVIIVDDGSTDNTRSVLSKSKIQNPKLKTFYQDNRGSNPARNRGFRETSGQYLLFCDADVIMKPEMLERMVKVLEERREASYAYSSFKFGWKKFKLWPFDAAKLKKMPYIHSTSLIKREHFPGWDESIKRLQDWDLFLTMSGRGHIGYWIPEVLFGVQTRRSGISEWLPAFIYKIPWHKLGVQIKRLEKYKQAEKIIKDKHHLN